MRRKHILYAIAAGTAIVPAALAVGPQFGMLRGSIGVEAEFIVDGDAIRPAVYDLSGAAGEDAEAGVDGLSMADAFDTGYGVSGEISYAVDNNVEVYGSVGYHSASGKSGIHVGDIDLPLSDRTLPITASFTDMESWSIEAGARYYAGTSSDVVRPFFGGNVGVRFVDGVDMSVRSALFNADIREYYEDSTLFTAGLEAGVEFGEGNVSGAFSVGAKYISELDANDDGLAALGLEALGGDSDQIVIPVKGSITVAF